jgi:preprotein translocase subunit SecG
MYILVLLIHIVVCLFLIIVILLQSGKAADLAGAFGGMGSQTAFGPRGSATLLSRVTTASAAIFMVTALTLSILATRNAGLATSVLEDQPVKSIPAKQMPVPVNPQPNSRTIQVPLPPPSKSNPNQPVPVMPAPAKK